MEMDKCNQASAREWDFVAYGTSISVEANEETGIANNGYSGSVAGNDLSVWSMNGRGKLVPASTDGLAFYYTVMDPKTENFTISADISVDEWTFSNGQDGFGIMACDSIGEMGDMASFWNNSYMASVTKVMYYYDHEKGEISGQGSRYVMNLGIGAQEKRGITPENVANETQMEDFLSTMTPLDITAAEQGRESGSYNRVGGYSNEGRDLGDIAPLVHFHLSIQRNNTGYIISYRDGKGKNVSQTYYKDGDRDALTYLESDRIYLGFFAARNAKISVRNVELTTIAPEEDEPAKERELIKVAPMVDAESGLTANSEAYELILYGNLAGDVEVTGADGTVYTSRVLPLEQCRMQLKLAEGVNPLQIKVTPDADFRPTRFECLSSYEPITRTYQVEYRKSTAPVVYAHPEGVAAGQGTKEAPLDIRSAVAFAAPGQTILLAGGTYDLSEYFWIPRSTSGTPEQRIVMKADPEAQTRPVLDFGQKCIGVIMEASYWDICGLDVTNTAPGKGGIRMSGSYNLLDNLKVYRNGNTGLQLSRCNIHDERPWWPSYNLIRNCTSYLNADAGYTDADGFAAKITVGDGNIFDGCISAYNADDGFDLFAKVERGRIGMVTIRNSITFRNGYVIGENGEPIHVGLGNGFKLGGSSIPGGHTLEDCVAFANGEKGIDSNSCPDVTVTNCYSYNNESFNVALYTTDAKDTDFLARGIVSVRDDDGPADQLEPRGSQDMSGIQDESNYYYNGTNSQNCAGAVLQSNPFEGFDIEEVIRNGIVRGADGSIRALDLLKK